jgi:hypothetical protein
VVGDEDPEWRVDTRLDRERGELQRLGAGAAVGVTERLAGDQPQPPDQHPDAAAVSLPEALRRAIELPQQLPQHDLQVGVRRLRGADREVPMACEIGDAARCRTPPFRRRDHHLAPAIEERRG